MAKLSNLKSYSPHKMLVEEFMITDLFTVRKDDLIELVADMMDWKNIRYTPVENAKGELIGMITSQQILNHFINHAKQNGKKKSLVKDIMLKKPVTIDAKANVKEAMKKMKKHNVPFLPVVMGKELVGLITEHDFLRTSNRLIERK